MRILAKDFKFMPVIGNFLKNYADDYYKELEQHICKYCESADELKNRQEDFKEALKEGCKLYGLDESEVLKWL